MSFELAIQKLIHKKYDNSEFFCDITGCEECCGEGHCVDLNGLYYNLCPSSSEEDDPYTNDPFFNKKAFYHPGFNTWP